jgi:hypothetical protein
MTLAGLSMLIAIAIGYGLGGRLRNLIALRIRWPLAAVIGLALQLVPVHGVLSSLVFPSLVVSFGLLGAFAIANIRMPGFPLVLAGVTANVLVIALNHGMPVTHWALAAAHQLGSLPELERGGARYHLAGPGDVLVPLADSIGSAFPLRMVISPGDLAIYAGMVWFLVWGMRRHPAHPPAAAEAAVDPADAMPAASADRWVWHRSGYRFQPRRPMFRS